MSWDLISLPVVAALIGWGTNVIAIRMLFWPRKPINILGWQFLGVLPKRKMELARSIAEVLNDEILPLEELLARPILLRCGRRWPTLWPKALQKG